MSLDSLKLLKKIYILYTLFIALCLHMTSRQSFNGKWLIAYDMMNDENY